jgi:hypothetical protein
MNRSLRTRLAYATVLVASAVTAACSGDSVTAPKSSTPISAFASIKAPVNGALKLVYPMEALTRDVPLAQPVTRSFTFDKRGGPLEIKELGLKVDIPPDAIPGTSLTITVTALPGADVAYDFQPHGTVFRKALKFNQELRNTSWDKSGFKGTIVGGYFEFTSQLHGPDGVSLLDELFSVRLDDKRASFDIFHFSGYMVSSGRHTSYSDSAF